jgi:hypothetical protein
VAIAVHRDRDAGLPIIQTVIEYLPRNIPEG